MLNDVSNRNGSVNSAAIVGVGKRRPASRTNVAAASGSDTSPAIATSLNATA